MSGEINFQSHEPSETCFQLCKFLKLRLHYTRLSWKFSTLYVANIYALRRRFEKTLGRRKKGSKIQNPFGRCLQKITNQFLPKDPLNVHILNLYYLCEFLHFWLQYATTIWQNIWESYCNHFALPTFDYVRRDWNTKKVHTKPCCGTDLEETFKGSSSNFENKGQTVVSN